MPLAGKSGHEAITEPRSPGWGFFASVKKKSRAGVMKPREKMIDDLAAFEEMLWRDLEAHAAAALPHHVRTYAPGAWKSTFFANAASVSSTVSSIVVRVLSKPEAEVASAIAAALILSGKSAIITTSSAPKAK